MELEIVSLHHTSYGRNLAAYMLDGIKTIGVFGHEPFAIRLSNTSPVRIQARISIDGTDVLTGQVATLSPGGRMFVVEKYGVLYLSSWPETTQGGAAFVFTTVENSVAMHTHGDITARGYISAAIFVEGYTPPQRTSPQITSSHIFREASLPKDTLRGPAVGAGSYQEQVLETVSGLHMPRYTQLVQIRYLWWDDLVACLREEGRVSQHPTGFTMLANLGATPHITTQPTPTSYQRVL